LQTVHIRIHKGVSDSVILNVQALMQLKTYIDTNKIYLKKWVENIYIYIIYQPHMTDYMYLHFQTSNAVVSCACNRNNR